MTDNQLISEFDNAMMQIYSLALSEAKYKATAFLQMLLEHRGLVTARKLINSTTVSTGYTSLWELGRLDLTVEALIVDNLKWQSLFTEAEINICKKRLKDYGYSYTSS